MQNAIRIYVGSTYHIYDPLRLLDLRITVYDQNGIAIDQQSAACSLRRSPDGQIGQIEEVLRGFHSFDYTSEMECVREWVPKAVFAAQVANGLWDMIHGCNPKM